MSPTRRDMLRLAVAGSATWFTGSGARAQEAARNEAATGLTAPVFEPLPLGSVRPAGWLRRQMEIQANGLGGHLDELWPDVGPNSGWLGGTGESWERGPYFLDGLVPLAWQLDDERLKQKAMRFLDWTLDHQRTDGALGPASLQDWWPMMIMGKALTQFEEATGDARVVPALTRYYHYQLGAMPARPLKAWARYRWQDEALTVAWLYERTKDAKLLELAALLEGQGYDWPAEFAHFPYTEPTTRAVLSHTDSGNSEAGMRTHGVNNSQGLKTAAVQHRFRGSAEDRTRFARQMAELYRYHGVPNGMFTCDEHLGGLEPSHGTELCSVVETMFSLEVAMSVFGDAALGDRIERIAYNALPGTFTDDMWAHQYDQQSNQVQVGLLTRPWTTNGPESNLYGLEPHFGCCTANFHQGWPKFTASLWMRVPESGPGRGDEGLAAALYAPCEVRTKVRGTDVHVTVQTEYPFRESVTMAVTPSRALRMPMLLRVPRWAKGASMRVNGVAVEGVLPGTFCRVERAWKAGDRIELTLPMQPAVSRWVREAVAVERGPLVFSLSPGETWVKLRDHRPGDARQPVLPEGTEFPVADWQVFPTAEWNYALAVGEGTAAGLRVMEAAVPEQPFSHSAERGREAAVRIEVEGHRLDAWRSEDGMALPMPASPVQSAQPAKTLTLVPYAAAKLRVTVFPQQGATETKGSVG